jgi:peptidoglycan/LPS O-acetylase OafA/YrhL
MERITAFDGVRGYSALWVAIVHLAMLFQLHELYVLPDSKYGLEIFFILSGYVITTLLQRKHETYGVFIFRRFLRLAPAFTILCIVYLLFAGIIIDSLKMLDKSNWLIQSQVAIYKHSIEDWYWHLATHITMTHGFFEQLLKHSSKAIIIAGWSMTVEWQYYLAAPALFWMIKNNKVFLLAGLLVFSVVFPYVDPLKGLYFTKHLMSFLIGTLTYMYLHQNPEALRDNRGSLILLLMIAVGIYGSRYEVALWSLFLLFVYGDVGEWANRTVRKILENKPIVYIGTISYSFYLNHMLVIYLSIYFLGPYVDLKNLELSFFIFLPIFLVLTTLLSSLTYHFIEEPGINWSKKVIARRQQAV